MDNTILAKRNDETDFEYKVKLCIAKLNKETDLDWSEIADIIGFPHSSDHLRKLAYAYKEMIDNGYVLKKSVDDEEIDTVIKLHGETVEIQKDGSHKSSKLIHMSAAQSKDETYILKAHGYDPLRWEVVSTKSSIWNQHNKKDGTVTLYSSKLVARPIKDELSVQAMEDIFKRIYKNYKPRKHQPQQYIASDKMLEINIADLHIGKLGWVGTSNDHYDVNVAKERFFTIINDVLTRTKNYSFEKILFIWSNDFFHFDNESKTTTNGTRQDTAVQFHQMYELGNEILIQAIDMLADVAPVHTMYIGSNHDKLTSYFATMNLKSWFRNDDRVTVDADPKIRKYYEFGQCLIGFAHGSFENKRLGKVMPIEAKEAWGRTKYHEIHAAHIHSEEMYKEENGTIVRHLPSVAGTDQWHYESAYIGAIKKSQSFVWDKELGLLEIINSVV